MNENAEQILVAFAMIVTFIMMMVVSQPIVRPVGSGGQYEKGQP